MKCFVLIGGWPASGKTTLAQALAAELKLPLIEVDTNRPVDVASLARAVRKVVHSAARDVP